METTSKEMSPGIVELKFKGPISEKSVFPKFENQPLTQVILNMDEVPNINSMGILQWIRWWKDLQKRNSGILFQVEKLRMPLLSCASVVAGFLPDPTEVLSFYLPYHCEEEGLDHQELLKKGVHYDDETLKLHETITRSHQGRDLQYEVDCVPNRDLRILGLKIINE